MIPRPLVPLSPAAALGSSTLPSTISTISSLRRSAPRASTAPTSPCPADMQLVERSFCVDTYEASTVEIHDDGSLVDHSPFLPVAGLRVKVVSTEGVVPQAYISKNEAEAACREAGKRLCQRDEWVTACKGPAKTRFPYGEQRKGGACVDTGRVSPLDVLFATLGPLRYFAAPMNDPRLNQLPRTVAKTGSSADCTNGFHVFDMVGNVHEWTAESRSTFRGGYYLDTRINGEGCDYRTIAHPATYHDYSTGFRCCADPG